MLDPLTAAAIVASLIALAGTTSKALDQFYRSIHDAPGIARDLLSGLYALNAALSQIQETRAIAEMTYHKVNNIQDICQSAVDFRKSCKPFAEPTVLGCTKRLPSDYTKKEVKTLQSYSPIFSLTLADLGDDSTGAFRERWLESSDPLPCIMFSFELGQFAKLCELGAKARFGRHISTCIAGIPLIWPPVLIRTILAAAGVSVPVLKPALRSDNIRFPTGVPKASATSNMTALHLLAAATCFTSENSNVTDQFRTQLDVFEGATRVSGLAEYAVLFIITIFGLSMAVSQSFVTSFSRSRVPLCARQWIFVFRLILLVSAWGIVIAAYLKFNKSTKVLGSLSVA